MLDRCKERIGDSFSFLDLINGRTGFARVQEICGYAEGGNGDIGFVAELDVASPGPGGVSDDIFGERIAGAAFPASTPAAVKVTPVIRLATKDLERIQGFLCSQLDDESCRVLRAIKNPADGAMLVVAEHKRKSPESDRGTSVFYLLCVRSTLQMVPFAETPYSIAITPEKGFPVDIYPGCREDTRFSFLPDIDHDGHDEVFVSCREGFIYRITDKKDGRAAGSMPSLTPIRNFHYGMRE